MDIALLLLRLTVGGFQIPHGVVKLGFLGGDQVQIAKNFQGYGLWPPMLWVKCVGAAQLLLGILLVLGLATRPAALTSAGLCFGMAIIALRRSGWFWNRHGMEYAVFWGMAACCLVSAGPGDWSIDEVAF